MIKSKYLFIENLCIVNYSLFCPLSESSLLDSLINHCYYSFTNFFTTTPFSDVIFTKYIPFVKFEISTLILDC